MKLTCFYHFIKTIVDWLRCRKKHYWEAFQMRDVKKKHLRALGELSGKKPMRSSSLLCSRLFGNMMMCLR